MNNNINKTTKKMNFSNNLPQTNSKEFLLDRFTPYLQSSIKNRNYNPLSIYLSSNTNYSKPQYDLNSNSYVKKPLNLDISNSIKNSLSELKKENNPFIKRYTSFSNKNIINHGINKYNGNKKTLILDLDETLVHSAFTPFSRNSDLILNINVEGENRTLYVLKRPYVDKFLNELSSEYEIIIFTASISQYANPLLDELDKNNYIKYRLFREHCTFNNGIYIKDLKIIDRNINNMIIIDNNPLSYKNNVENGIPILSWYDNINDNELLKLIPLLKYMSNSNVEDVRTVINEIVDRNKNELDYSAINRIIDKTSISNIETNYSLSSINTSTTKDSYRRYNKSEEPKSKLSNKNGYYKNEYNYSYGEKYNEIPLKNNYIKKYYNENKNNDILNSKYNLNNNYNNKENISNNSIDKMDPYGTRISIFSPEEYNTSYTNSLNYSLNKINSKNKLEINSIENDNFNKTLKKQKENNDYILDDYSKRYNYSDFISKNSNEKRSYTPNLNNTIGNDIVFRNKGDFNLKKIAKKFSLVDLTKKALHLEEENSIYYRNGKKKRDYETIINSSKINRTLSKYNSYFNKENEIIYNDYINNNKYINNYKSNKDFTSNYLNNNYFNNEEEKNSNENYNSIDNKKIISSKNFNSVNERFMKTDKLIYNNSQISNNDNNKLLDRMKSQKINNFFTLNKGDNKLYQFGGSFYNNYESENNKQNNDSVNKDNNYFNFLKESLQQSKSSLNSKVINSKKDSFPNINQLNYDKSNNEKLYNNRYGIKDFNDNKGPNNLLFRHKSISYINDNSLSLDNFRDSNLESNRQSDYHQLTRSSSYVNFEGNKFKNKLLENNNYNKENINNNIEYKFQYGEKLNYNELINSQTKPKFSMNDNSYYNTFNRSNYLKY